MAQWPSGDACGEIGDQRDPQDLHTGGACGDRLVHRRHADEVGAHRREHRDLCGRLILRARQAGVDALAQRVADADTAVEDVVDPLGGAAQRR